MDKITITILSIITILTIGNALALVISNAIKRLGQTPENRRAVLTLVLAQTIKRQRLALYLGLGSIIYWVLTPTTTTSWVAPTLILVNLLLILVCQRKTREATALLKNCINTGSIAVLKLELPSNESTIDIWLKKTEEQWPPLELEIGMGPWAITATSLNQSLLTQIRNAIKNTKILETPNIKEELKKILNDYGVTHPIDIKGADTIPEIFKFLEETLLNKNLQPQKS